MTHTATQTAAQIEGRIEALNATAARTPEALRAKGAEIAELRAQLAALTTTATAARQWATDSRGHAFSEGGIRAWILTRLPWTRRQEILSAFEATKEEPERLFVAAAAIAAAGQAAGLWNWDAANSVWIQKK